VQVGRARATFARSAANLYVIDEVSGHISLVC
jgi:hypothetical protein